MAHDNGAYDKQDGRPLTEQVAELFCDARDGEFITGEDRMRAAAAIGITRGWFDKLAADTTGYTPPAESANDHAR